MARPRATRPFNRPLTRSTQPLAVFQHLAERIREDAPVERPGVVKQLHADVVQRQHVNSVDCERIFGDVDFLRVDHAASSLGQPNINRIQANGCRGSILTGWQPMYFTLGQAARHCGVAKGTISKAIKTGKLSATRHEDGSWKIDNAELARYLDANGHRFRSDTGEPDRAETSPATDALVLELRAVIADLRADREDLRQDRDHWRTVAERLSLPAWTPGRQPAEDASTPAPVEPTSRLRRAWRWMRATG
jgi:excisionase family DNA binding protein